MPDGKSYLGHNKEWASLDLTFHPTAAVCLRVIKNPSVPSHTHTHTELGTTLFTSAETVTSVAGYENWKKTTTNTTTYFRGINVSAPPSSNHSCAWHSGEEWRCWTDSSSRRRRTTKWCGLFSFFLSEEEVKIVCVRVSLGSERGLGTHTYADTLGEKVTPCLFLDHILYCCSRQLCQRSSKRYIVLYTLPGWTAKTRHIYLSL